MQAVSERLGDIGLINRGLRGVEKPALVIVVARRKSVADRMEMEGRDALLTMS